MLILDCREPKQRSLSILQYEALMKQMDDVKRGKRGKKGSHKSRLWTGGKENVDTVTLLFYFNLWKKQKCLAKERKRNVFSLNLRHITSSHCPFLAINNLNQHCCLSFLFTNTHERCTPRSTDSDVNFTHNTSSLTVTIFLSQVMFFRKC